MPRPCRRTRPAGPENRLERKAPAATDAVRAPVVIGPPPSSTAPIAGSSASGCPNVIAVMSRMNCSRMFDARLRNRQPSRSDSSPGRTSSPSGRMLGSVHSPRNSDIISTTSIEYVHAYPANATRMPASAGPAMTMIPNVMPFSADAAGSSSRGIRRGTIA